MADQAWVVWSFEHGGWWAANECGYHAHLLAAGLYTEARAKAIEERANVVRRHERAMPLATAIAEERERLGVWQPGYTVLDVVADSLAEPAPKPVQGGQRSGNGATKTAPGGAPMEG